MILNPNSKLKMVKSIENLDIPKRWKLFNFLQVLGTIFIISVNIFFICFVLLNSKSNSSVLPEFSEAVKVKLIKPISDKLNGRNSPKSSHSHNHKMASDVILFDNKYYDGKPLVLENANEGCTNILDFNDKVSSVLIDANSLNKTTCIRLYMHSACLGPYIELTAESNCKHDLSECPTPFDNDTSSVSRCDFKIPPNPLDFDPGLVKTTRGEACKNHCGIWGDSWYWCYTDDLMTKWDYCSPRPEVDYFGYECKDRCTFAGGKDYSWCNLKKGGWGYCSA